MRIAQPGKKFWAFENVAGQINPPPLGGLRVRLQRRLNFDENQKTEKKQFLAIKKII